MARGNTAAASGGFGIGVPILTWVLDRMGVEVPENAVLLIGGLCGLAILYAMYVWTQLALQRMQPNVEHKLIPSLMIVAGEALLLFGIIWALARPFDALANVPYLQVEIGNATDTTSDRPLKIVNPGPRSLKEVEEFISPAIARHNPDHPDFYKFRHLSARFPVLNVNTYLIGSLPPGTYWVDLQKENAQGFSQILRIVPVNGKLEQVFDIRQNGKIFYSSPRPKGWAEPEETRDYVRR